MTDLALVIGKTFYRLTFADRDMTMPHVEPLVYIGDGEHTDGDRFYAFQDTVSYVMFGSRFAPDGRDRDDLSVYFIPPQEIGDSLVDLEQAVAQVQDCLIKARALGWPELPALLCGRQSVAT
jgi:hypothetical protein